MGSCIGQRVEALNGEFCVEFRRFWMDETSPRKCHDCVTVVSGPGTRTVLPTADGWHKDSLSDFYEGFSDHQKVAVEHVALELRPTSTHATLEGISDSSEKIVFYKFHLAEHLGDAVGQLSCNDQKTLLVEGRKEFKHTEFRWGINPHRMSRKQWQGIKAPDDSALKTARSLPTRKLAMSLWGYSCRARPMKACKAWLVWAPGMGLEPLKNLARTTKVHLRGILNTVHQRADHGGAESVNSRIKMVKIRSHGFLNNEHYRNAISFHHGRLDLYTNMINS